MAEPTDIAADEQLPHEEGERGQRRLLQYLATGSIGGSFMMGSGPLFLLALGGGPFAIGLLATANNLSNTTRILGLKLMPRLGKARLLAWARLTSALFTLPLVPLALFAERGSTILPWAALALMTLRQATIQTGGTAWWPLVQDNTPKAAQSHFITRMRVTQRLSSLGLPLLAGWYLGSQPQAARFALPFALILVLVVLGSWLVSRVSERQSPPPSEAMWRRIREVLKVPAIRRYCVCFGLIYFVDMLTMPFRVVVLTERGLPVNYFVWMTSLMGLGELLTLPLWGRLIEKHGSRPALTASLLTMGLMAPAWLTLPRETATLIPWGSAFFFMWGVATAGYSFAQTRSMMDAVPARYQGEGFGVPNLVLAWGGGLGGFIGGLVFEWASTLEVSEGGQRDPTVLYLMATQLLYFGGLLVSRRLIGHSEQTPVNELLKRLVRRRRMQRGDASRGIGSHESGR